MRKLYPVAIAQPKVSCQNGKQLLKGQSVLLPTQPPDIRGTCHALFNAGLGTKVAKCALVQGSNLYTKEGRNLISGQKSKNFIIKQLSVMEGMSSFETLIQKKTVS